LFSDSHQGTPLLYLVHLDANDRDNAALNYVVRYASTPTVHKASLPPETAPVQPAPPTGKITSPSAKKLPPIKPDDVSLRVPAALEGGLRSIAVDPRHLGHRRVRGCRPWGVGGVVRLGRLLRVGGLRGSGEGGVVGLFERRTMMMMRCKMDFQ
jgi:hypothetical protein